MESLAVVVDVEIVVDGAAICSFVDESALLCEGVLGKVNVLRQIDSRGFVYKRISLLLNPVQFALLSRLLKLERRKQLSYVVKSDLPARIGQS